MWDKEVVPDSKEYLCIHEIPRPTTPTPLPQPIAVIPAPQPYQGVPSMPPQQTDQVEVAPEFEWKEPGISEDIPDLLDVPQEVMSDFDAWAQDVLHSSFR